MTLLVIGAESFLITDAAGRGVVIGSACLWTNFQLPRSSRNVLVTRRETGTISSLPPTLALTFSTSTTHARFSERYFAMSSTLVTSPSQ